MSKVVWTVAIDCIEPPSPERCGEIADELEDRVAERLIEDDNGGWLIDAGYEVTL